MPRRLCDVVLVACAYYAAGRLSQLLAIPPGYSSGVWLPAGLALVAILLRGNRVWPGVLLGHFCVNTWPAYFGSSAQDVSLSLWLPLIIACGGTLQALCAAALVRRYVGAPVMLRDEKEAARFLLLGGGVSCLISSTVGNASLFAWGRVPSSDLPFSWFTWWAGDTIGVVVVAPLLLVWLGQPRRHWRVRRVALTGPAVVVLALALGLYAYLGTMERQRVREEFERTAGALAQDLESTARHHVDAVVALQDLYNSMDNLNRATFAAFATQLLSGHPGVQVLAWAPVVEGPARAQFERTARRDDYAQFSIREGGGGGATAAADRSQYVPLLYVQPQWGNESALGFDLASQPDLRAVLERARDSGLPTASGRVTLVQEPAPAHESGVLVAMPVYGALSTDAGPAQRAGALRGFTVGVYRVGDLLQAALPSEKTRSIAITLTDESAPQQQLLYRGGTEDASLPWQRVFPISVADRHWSMRLAPAAGYASAHRSRLDWTVLAAGLGFVSVLEMMILTMTRRAAWIQGLIEERTAQLQEALKEKETLLQEIHHRVKNNLQVITSLINVQRRAVQPGPVQAALQECQTRVQAIALVHEKLYEARNYARIPFSEYVKGLADNVFDAGTVSAQDVTLQLNVGAVELSVDKAIPCGLILNELMTNALKHAFPPGRRGTIRVELGMTDSGQVKLAVRDDGVGLPPDLDARGSGTFGLQLVRTLAEQLSARLEYGRTDGTTWFELLFER